jgi:hypothetical protein
VTTPEKRAKRRRILDWVAIVGTALLFPALFYVATTRLSAVQDRAREELAATAEATRLDACQKRNSAQEAARSDIDVVLDAVEARSSEGAEFRAELEPHLSTADDFDTDCNHDGKLTDADYEPGQAP